MFVTKFSSGAGMDAMRTLEGSEASGEDLVTKLSPGYPPRPKRKCTDRFCIVLLVAFMSGMGYLYRRARAEGDLAKLTHGFDWTGKICGVDEAVRDKPLLFWCTPNGEEGLTLLDGICVARCPSSRTEQFFCPGPAVPFEVKEFLDPYHRKQEVVIGMRRNLTEKPSYPSVEAFGYCFPKEDLVLLQSVMDRTYVSSFTRQVILAGQGAAESWRFLVLVAIACIVIGYAFLFVIWHSFEKLVYGLIVAVHVALLAVAGVFLFVSFQPEHNFFFTYFSPPVARMCAWACAALAVVFWMLFAFLCCQGRESLAVTIDSVTATCEVIAEIPSMLMQPLLHSAIVVLALLGLVYGLAWILSTGKVVPLGEPLEQSGIQIAGVHRNLEFTDGQWASIAYWLFGLVWIFEIMNALGQFAISHAVVINTVHQEEESYPMLHGYVVGITFHLGSITFGAFVIGCLKLAAAAMSFVLNQARDEQGVQSTVAQVLCCCCLCTVACIERVLSMVNDLIYTDVALRSCGYMQAADHVVSVAASNPLTYAAIKAAATAMRVVGVTIIGGCGTFLSYQALSSTQLHRQLDSVFENSSTMLVTSNILGTTIAAGLICFYVALAFMVVFYQTTYSLMYCMLLGAGTGGASGLDIDQTRMKTQIWSEGQL
mmetsp:Transcript_56322/g.132142  ORF Transcript_56322/g.132142 Transcript_56322/m.132142 type:complete len:653 (+) Transcript_56322:35-1993(+)